MRLKWSRFILSLVPAIVLALGIILLGGLELSQSYNDFALRGEETAQNLVHVLAEQTERTFQAIDFTLLSIRDSLAATPDVPDNDVRFRKGLQERLKGLPYVRALYVIGPDGFILHDTDYPSTPKVSLADRSYFKAHQEDPDLGLHIGQPLRSRSVSVWFVSFSRRISRQDGSFGGVVVAAVEPRYFESFYRGLSVGENGFISLLLQDGTLLARSPASEEAIGKSFATASSGFSRVAGSPRGVYWSTSPVDGTPRVVGYQALRDAPIVVLVGLAQETVFRPWRRHTIVVLVIAAILLALIGLLVFLLEGNRRREQIEQTRLNRAQRLEALGRIAGGIAHDFGNMIRVIQSTCLLLKPSLAGKPDALLLINDTDHFLKSAKVLIERLLAFARRQELRPQLTMVDDLIVGFAPILKQAVSPQICIDFKLGSTSVVSLIDPVQFEATLLNLVLNARDAMPGGGTIAVETEIISPPGNRGRILRSHETANPWVQISITDSGFGMSPAVLEQAFDPFYTTKEPGQGNGLGLSQVLGFVQQSAGEVYLESKEGHGTRVCLMFPTVAKDDRIAAGSAPVAPAELVEEENQGSSGKRSEKPRDVA